MHVCVSPLSVHLFVLSVFLLLNMYAANTYALELHMAHVLICTYLIEILKKIYIVRGRERKVKKHSYKNEMCTLLEGGFRRCESGLSLCTHSLVTLLSTAHLYNLM